MNPLKIPPPELWEYSPVRKLLQHLLLCHMQKKDYAASASISKPIPYRNFLKGSKDFVQDVINSGFVEPHSTNLDDLLKSGYKPKRLELGVPINSKRIWLFSSDPQVRRKIEFLTFLGAPPELISEELSNDSDVEIYSPEEVSLYNYFHFNLNPQHGFREEYRYPLIEYFANSPTLREYYRPLIDLTAGRIGPEEILDMIGSHNLMLKFSKQYLYEAEAITSRRVRDAARKQDDEISASILKNLISTQNAIKGFKEIPASESDLYKDRPWLIDIERLKQKPGDTEDKKK